MRLLLLLCFLSLIGTMSLAASRFAGEYGPDKGIFEPSDGHSELCLNGKWNFQGSTDPDYQFNDSAWEKTSISIPSPWNVNSFSEGNGGDFRCYPGYPKEWEDYAVGCMQKKFDIPAEWADKQIYLCFRGIAGSFVAELNGQKAGEGFDNFMPHTFDITPFAVPGKTNTVTVKVRAASLYGIDRAKGNITYPSGSFWGMHIRGIWQDVFVYATEKVAISDVYIQPSLSKKHVTATITLANHTNSPKIVSVKGSVYKWITGNNGKPDAANRGKADFSKALSVFPGRQATIPAGGTATVDLVCNGSALPRWSMDEPNLLLGSFTLSGAGNDRYDQRFGYREFHITGNNLYLNGKKIVLMGDSWHFMGIPQMTRRYPYSWYTAIKAANGNAVRLHAQPYPEFYMDMADEMGIAVLDETAIWESHCAFNFFEPVFWERSYDHLKRLVLRDRNHPGVFGWSVENEITGGMGVAGHTPEERAMVLDKCREFYNICRTLDPSRTWVSGDGCEDLGGSLPTNMLHYGGYDYCKEVSKRNKPWGIGEATAAYYGTPKELSRWNGDRAYESMEGRMEALAYETWDHLANNQRSNNAAYMCVFNLAWYALQPLELGLEDTSKAPTLEDGIFFDPQKEGQIGIQPERLGPYTTTFNPGYDPSLPLYREWPMFEAIKDAYEPKAAKKGRWSKQPALKSDYGYPKPWIDSICYVGEHSKGLYTPLKLAGWNLTDDKKAAMLLIDGTGITDSNIADIKKLADEFTKSGRIVFVWGFTSQNADLISRLTGAGVVSVDRKATSMISRYMPASALYFTESTNKDIMTYGIGGDILKKGNRVINPCNAEWDRWNYKGENIKTAAILRSEREAKPDAAAFVSVPKDKSKVLLCSINTKNAGKDTIALYKELAAFLGIKLAPMAQDENAPVSALGDVQKLLASQLYECADFDEANNRDFIEPKENIDTTGWNEIQAGSNGIFDFDGTKHLCKTVYMSLWLYSPKALDELLADPNVPKITLTGGSDDGLRIFVNGRQVYADASVHPCQANYFTTQPLPIHQGWNQIVFKVSQQDGQWQLMSSFECTDMDFWSTVEFSLTKPEDK